MLTHYMKNGALGARTKCMYGKRITRAQYETLVSKHDVSDVILYLKSETDYREAFAGVNENMLYFGLVESLIRRDIYGDYLKICSLAFGYDRKLMDFVLLRAEMSEILSFVMLLLSGRQGDYRCGLPDLLLSRSKIAFTDLAQSADYPAFLEKLRGTAYHSVLSGFVAQPAPAFTEIEVAVTLDHYRRLQKIVADTPDAYTRDAMMKHLRAQTDMMNISRIKRMKKYYAYSPEDVSQNLVRPGKSKDKALIRSLIEADEEGIDAILADSRYGPLATGVGEKDFEKTYYSLIAQNGRRIMYGAVPTALTALAYIELKEIEMRNLITIVEGIRYGVTPSKIMDYLVV